MQKITAEELFSAVRYNNDGLVPVITQQFDTKEVLMMAWANEKALKETVETGRMCYFSRSRQQLWRKGETSGHTQKLIELRIDCDGDTLLALIDQTGAACHTNNRSCFYRGL
ncbi:MAG: phosphoribosyl-AMP cyclohydrolase [Alphaproteobacteria bacterium]|nr:phosphoribosyl-AMP cyclohydrolase [Alphaproteobacteria bacterium]